MKTLVHYLSILGLAISCKAQSLPITQEAINQAARAFYVQQHWDEEVEAIKRHTIDRHVNQRIQNIATWVFLVGRAVKDQEISWKWSFP